jgi:HAMP domain-containing protein
MSVKISDNTSIGLPLRNLIGLIGAIVVGAWFAFGVIERLNQLETRNKLFEKDLLEASVQKPIDQEQFMLLEWQAKQLEKVQKILEENLHTNVMLEQHEKEIEKLKKDVEKLKDSTRDIKFGNGNGNGKH